MIARTNQTPQINLLFTLDVAINKVPKLEETDPLQEPESKKQQISQDVLRLVFRSLDVRISESDLNKSFRSPSQLSNGSNNA